MIAPISTFQQAQYQCIRIKGKQQDMDPKDECGEKNYGEQRMSQRSQQGRVQFQRVRSTTKSDIVLFEKRSKIQTLHTPKVVMLKKHANFIDYLVQNPKDCFFSFLKDKNQHQQILLIQTAFECLCQLAWVYGYFIIHPGLLKVTSERQILIWIHSDFKINRRQQPLLPSPESETVFVQSFISTFSNFIQFAFKNTIKSVATLNNRLRQIKTKKETSRIQKIIQANKKLSANKMQLSITPKIKKYKSSPQKSNSNQQTVNPEQAMADSEKSLSEHLKNSPLRKLTNNQKQRQKKKKSKINRLDSLRSYSPTHDQRKTIYTARDSHKGDNSFFNNLSSSLKMQRKDLNLSMGFLKEWGTFPTKNFQNVIGNSFSTRVTISSKADSDFMNFQQEPKGKKIFFPTAIHDSFSNKKRLSADLQRIFRESKQCKGGQLDFTQWFECEELNLLKNSIKEVQLRRQFQNLFHQVEFGQIDEQPEVEADLIAQFAQILI